MGLRKNAYTIKRSNDRPNVHLLIHEFQYPMSSFLDLAFLVLDNSGPDWKPLKFLIFFDDISDSVAAVNFLNSRLPPPLQNKLRFVWFNADMTPEFHEQYTEYLRASDGVFGLCCTDSFGMVVLHVNHSEHQLKLQ